MEFTKGMTVRSKKYGYLVAVTKKSHVGTFNGIIITGENIGYDSVMFVTDYFHPFDLPSAIEEALKKEKV